MVNRIKPTNPFFQHEATFCSGFIFLFQGDDSLICRCPRETLPQAVSLYRALSVPHKRSALRGADLKLPARHAQAIRAPLQDAYLLHASETA